MKKAIKIFTLLVPVLMQSCGYDKFGEWDVSGKNYIAATMHIEDLREIYSGQPLTFYDDVVIAGYVTADDRTGNFYRSFMIQDISGAIEVRAGLYDLWVDFPVGRYTAVRCLGLTLGSYNGILQVGLRSEGSGNYQTAYFDYQVIFERYVFPADRYAEIDPLTVAVSHIDESLCGVLVKVDNLKLVADEDEQIPPDKNITWAEEADSAYSSDTYRLFEDRYGGRISVQTSVYADFAQEIIPSGYVTLTGILSKSSITGVEYNLIIRDLNDVQQGIIL